MKSVSEKKSRGHRTSKIVKSNQSYNNGHLLIKCCFFVTDLYIMARRFG